MFRVFALVALLYLAVGAAGVNAQSGVCDRDCLRGVLDRYLDAVVENAPEDSGVIVGFRQTENAVVIPLGEGVWESVTGLGDMQRRYLDTVTGQAAFFGLVDESGETAIASVRVKVENREILEAEWYIGRAGQPGMAGAPQPDGSGAAPYDPQYLIDNPPPAERVVPVSERLSRSSLLGITNSYFDAITVHNPDVMMSHPDCDRMENGLRVTGRPMTEDSGDGYQGRSNCSSGIRKTGRLNSALVTARRSPVVDEVQQVVLGMAVFLREPESVNRRLSFSEFFFIDDALISSVYAAMYYAAPDLVMPNWPPYGANFPLPVLSDGAN